LAGVSERTIRNAESGKRLFRDFLEYIAGALEVPLLEVAQFPTELRVDESLASRILTAFFRLFDEGDFSELKDLFAPTASLVQPGPPSIPLYGTYHGAEIEKFYQNKCFPLLRFRTERPQVRAVHVGENFISVYITDAGLGAPTGKVAEPYSGVITFTLENDRIILLRNVAETHTVVKAFSPDDS
jgi:transcriptional regulator with XRE-family HTH domain